MKTIKQNIPMMLVLAIALVLRLWRLDLNPIGIIHDEMHQFVNAKSLALTGTGAAGTVAGIFQANPYCDGNCVFGELPSYLLIPFAFFNYTFPWVKLPFIIVSLAIVFFVAKLFENLTDNKHIGIIAALMVAINPWSINFGRTAYENLFSFMFYLWSLYLLTKKPFKLNNQIWAIILGFAASLSYFGAKPIYVPLMFAGLAYGFWYQRKHWLKYLLLAISTIVIIASYGLILQNSYAGRRLNETKQFNNEIISQVNDQRRMSLDIPLVRDIFINKYTVLSKVLIKKYLIGLSPNYLFNEGELDQDHFMIVNHSYMYLIDFPLIIISIYFLAITSPAALFFILSLIFIFPITPMLGNAANTYALRSGLTYPILAALTSPAIYFMLKKSKNKFKTILLLLLIFLYSVSLTNFLIMYWFRNPFEKNSGWVFYEREAIKYISLIKEIKPDTKFVVVSMEPVDAIYAYGFFTGKINDKNFITKMNQTISSGEYSIDNIQVSKICPDVINPDTVYLLYKFYDCVKDPNNLPRIADPRDSGTKWFLPNEILCHGIKLPRYPYPRKLQEFSIEKMDRQTFCQTWVSQP